MTVDEIRELIQLVSETGIAELEVQRGENRVRIHRAAAAGTQGYAPVYVQAPAVPPSPNAPAVAGSSGVSTGTEQVKETSWEVEAGPESGVKLVKSPIVGTFYESPSPGTPPFVRIGESVQPGRVLCIIESMKLMNEIEAEFPGVVESRLVPNGQPVEYGEALFAIRAT